MDGFKLLYKVFIRPHLEFCVQAWSPYFKKDIDCREKVQCRATKMVYGLGNIKYEDRIERLNLFLLQYRRMRGDMIKTYKIFKIRRIIKCSINSCEKLNAKRTLVYL